MKNVLFLIVLFLLISCGSKSDKSDDTEAKDPETGLIGSSEEKDTDAGSSEIVPHQLIDNKNQVMATLMFPVNWMIHNEPGKAAYSGPGNIFVYTIPVRNFMQTNDRMMQQSYIQNGGKLRVYTSAEEIVQQDFVPIANRDGSKLIKITSAPEIAQRDQSIQDMMFHIGPINVKYEAVVTDWEDKDGKPYTIIVHLNGNDMGNMIIWSYSGHGLDAPANRYESARNTLIKGLASLKYNPRYFDQYNRNEQNMASASWSSHHQRMSNQQRSFDAHQEAFKDKNDAINQSISSNYQSRMASMDKNHNRFMNYIKDEETVKSSNGDRRQVQNGSNQYYMNGNNQYIGTNDPNYNPNSDQNVNNNQWNEVQVED